MGVSNGGGGGGGSSDGSTESSVISKEEVVEQENNSNSNIEVSDESELELGLGLSLGCNNSSKKRSFTAKDLPSPPSASSCSSLGLRPSPSVVNPSNNNLSVGTKRAVSPTAVSQVVGWPPIRAYRMNSMANQAKSVAAGENNSEFNDNRRKDVIYDTDEKGIAKPHERVPVKRSLFVKVNMDGVAIGRKVDLNAHSSYEYLAQTLEEMFSNRAVEKSRGEELILMPKVTRPSKLLDGLSDYVLTYEDKDGDWMLVGDVPWGMFLNSVKRLRIMRTSEANGLAPRSEERSAKQRNRPI